MARVFKSATAIFDGRKYELTRFRRSRALPTQITRLNRSRIKYTPGLCGTSRTFSCKSGFCFLNAAMRLQIYVRKRQVETRPRRAITRRTAAKKAPAELSRERF